MPPLSPQHHHLQTITTGKNYFPVKNGFDFANNLNDKAFERRMDLKLTSSIREKERRKSQP